MIDFSEILSDVYFKNLGIPLLSVILTTSFKVVSRKDNALKVNKNDIAVGINLIIASIIMLINYSVRVAEKVKGLNGDEVIKSSNVLLSMLVLVLLYTLIAFGLTVYIRIYGWKEDKESELKSFQGVFVPLFVGGIMLVIASNFTNQ
jgi:formate hydrogenlyase subunit 3/multisubunit Na+/H+ antiporter MnhD subunit